MCLSDSDLNSNVDFAFDGIHATFLIQNHICIHHGSEKTLGGFKHMTTHIQNTTTIESISTFPNLVWHEFEINTEAICMVLNSVFTMHTKVRREY